MHRATALALAVVSVGLFAVPFPSAACSVLYFYDETTATAYVANNEDYWLDQEVVIRIVPARGQRYGRLWYGWDDFAQGGVNEHGLFFDGAVTPESEIPPGYGSPRGNLGDRMLANCRSVEEALELLDREKVALRNAHVMIGDGAGNAVVIEWMNSQKSLTWIADQNLIMTNFLLAAVKPGKIECPRYRSIQIRVNDFRERGGDANLLVIGNLLGAAAQLPRPAEEGRMAGTLYSTFLNLTEMELVFVPRLDSSQARKFDLRKEFATPAARQIRFE